MAENRHVEVAASAVRTATWSSLITTFDADAAYIVVDVTLDAAAASVVFNFALYDPSSGKSVTILESAAVAAVGTTTYRIGPELTAAANTIAKDYVPPVLKITATHADADAITYSVGLHLA